MKQKSVKEFETYLRDERDPLAAELRALRELPVAEVRRRAKTLRGWIGWLARPGKDKKK